MSSGNGAAATGTPVERIAAAGVVAVIEIDDPAKAEPLSDALAAGGITALEITFRTPAAAEVISWIAGNRPGMLVGAGTVLDAGGLERAREAGARFAVSPASSDRLLDAAADSGLPLVPGVANPSDILRCLEHGLTHLKLFPAGVLGGLAALEAFSAPFAPSGVRFMPTGGITPANAADYLATPSVFAIGGTWIARRGAIAAGDWDAVRSAAQQAAAMAASTRDQVKGTI
ncbi:bifunctional 4-hydroxy-2-oxoglutarate aldolase/2-dehydro-3-deoxy-phosphogluconate aldolase [Streptomyces sp. MMS24-I2-30]|uniref:bifunctional 4-hydroxy-2-oxoglutarate aldolase/2-dehydro-3-deoxy-phosphogluconate aldolase n=1 Tax=Streptomyces sp. MMS24-I2-30 TaxID=3351564 RepID=UPI003896EEB4